MKDYCIQIFGKSIREITIEDLLYFFNDPKEESEILEFKSGNGEFEKAFNNNILRTVSAFLNSSGGVLIWGAPEDKAPEKGMPKVCTGDLVPVKEKKEKDQLINRISSSISYMPTGILVERLDTDEGYIYVIEVQESESKPHQLNGQYFIRLDGQSKPAPHYIVDSMFKQIKYPNIENHIKIVGVYQSAIGLHIKFELKLFNFTPSIPGKEIQIYARTTVGNFQENDSDYLKSQPEKLLCYGLNPSTFITLHLNTSLLMDGLEYLDIIIYMTGENILTKISQHEINLSNGYEFDKIKILPLIDNLEVHKAENNLMNERESILKEFLIKD